MSSSLNFLFNDLNLSSDSIKRVKIISQELYLFTQLHETVEKYNFIQTALKENQKIYNFSKNFIELSKLDFEKIDKSTQVYKFISKNQKLHSFLIENNSYISSGIKNFTKLRYLNSGPVTWAKKAVKLGGKFFTKAAPYLKVAGYAMLAVDASYKFYKNYQSTKNIGASLIGTAIDFMEDFNFLQGLIIGAHFGPIGAIVGAGLGLTNFLVKLIFPNFYKNLKTWAMNKFTNTNHQINISTTTEKRYQVDLDIIKERREFYFHLKDNLQLIKNFLFDFMSDLDKYSESKSFFKIKSINLTRVIKNTEKLITQVEKMLEALAQFLIANDNLALKEKAIVQRDSRSLIFEQDKLTSLISTLQNINNHVPYYSSFSLDLDKSYIIRRIEALKRQNYLIASNLIHRLTSLSESITQIERSNYFDIY